MHSRCHGGGSRPEFDPVPRLISSFFSNDLPPRNESLTFQSPTSLQFFHLEESDPLEIPFIFRIDLFSDWTERRAYFVSPNCETSSRSSRLFSRKREEKGKIMERTAERETGFERFPRDSSRKLFIKVSSTEGNRISTGSGFNSRE